MKMKIGLVVAFLVLAAAAFLASEKSAAQSTGRSVRQGAATQSAAAKEEQTKFERFVSR
jgi:hypothetical protein